MHPKNELLCKILESIKEGIEPKHRDLHVEFEDFANAAEIIHDKGLATNVAFARGGSGNKIRIVFMNNSKITQLGEYFLEQARKSEKRE